MFKNRSLNVSVVKNNKKPNAPYDQGTEENFRDKTIAVKAAAKDFVRGTAVLVAGCVIAYVVADTGRQVAVELAKK